MKKAKLEALRHKNRDYLLSQMQDKADKKVQALELKTLQVGVWSLGSRLRAIHIRTPDADPQTPGPKTKTHCKPISESIQIKRPPKPELQAGILDADTKEYEKAEKEKVEQKKYRYYQHKLELQQQIQDKQAQEKNIEMSSAEASLNKDLLELVSKALTERDAGN